MYYYLIRKTPREMKTKNGLVIVPSSNAHDIITFVVVFCKRDYGEIKLGSVIVDVGANIGLATYSLVNEFKSLKKVIGIEAESLNYGMLEANYKQFNKMSLDRIVFEPVHALASNYSGSYVAPKKSINEFDKKTTSSGTFRFSPTLKPTKNDVGIRSISLGEILSKKNIEEGIIVKIDIEGGEKYLFEKNHDWLKKVLYVTIELHDRYGIGLVDSSKNFLAD